jgi:hypothetical protein
MILLSELSDEGSSSEDDDGTRISPVPPIAVSKTDVTVRDLAVLLCNYCIVKLLSAG